MPVRIYDIAKKLGIESKEVLARAKDLGISTARVPSSSLDKITAAYLEEQLGGVRIPEPPPAPPEPVVVITAAPEPPPALPPEPVPTPAPAEIPAPTAETPVLTQVPELAPTTQEPPALPTPSPVPSPAPAPEVSHLSEPAAASPAPNAPSVFVAPVWIVSAAPVPAAVITPPQPVDPPPPPPPAAPRIGDKVGSIVLPPRPQPRPIPGRSAPPPRPASPQPPTRPGQRPYPGQPQRPPFQGRPGDSRPSTPPSPRFVAPTTGTLITLKPPIVVRDLAERINRKPFQVIADLMELGVFATVNQAIDEPVAQRVCAKHGFRFEVEKRERAAHNVHAPKKPVETDLDDKPEDLKPRAPVVTIMGHVDHGKTTLLDTVRKSNVAAREAGGITQHIGAYTISIPHPERKKELQQITFLDTPGHAAFSSMRARGANVTDIVVLVVAANDGVMPQTLEALSHAQAAKVPIVVAVNKSDHPNANGMKVRQQLQDKGLVCEEWGGSTIFVDCSGLTGTGVDKLLELLVLQAEILELKANPTRAAKGNIIESGLEPGGPTATVLVRKGTLRPGDVILSGQFYGKVRALINEEAKRLKEAGPSVAVKVLGLNGVPEAGLEFSVIKSAEDARDMAEERLQEIRTREQEIGRPRTTWEDIISKTGGSVIKTLRVVVKADTQGSVEAIVDALKKIESDKVNLDVIHSAVGTITKEDVMLASASKAVILGFHTRIDTGVADVAKHEGVQTKLYAIIYELIDEVTDAMAGLLDPIIKEVVTGSAEVRKIFPLSKGGNVAGCVIASGRIAKGRVRVVRRRTVVYEGLTSSLRRFQDEVNEVRAGMECGIRIDGFNDFQIGDALEAYMLEKVAQKL